MKFARFGDGRLGVVIADSIVDITGTTAETQSGRLHDLIVSGSTITEAELKAAPRQCLDEVRLLAPLPLPPKIVAAPVNYLDHKVEMKVTHTVADLGVFLKAHTSVIGPNGVVRLPFTDVRHDQEAELGVVIGARCHNISPDDALDAVFGYTCLFDMTLRSTEDRSTRKSFDTFTPLGPVVVTKDEVGDPSQLRMSCWVNGEPRQDTSTGDLIFDVPTLIAYVSSVMTLEPGDVIATGTPAGVGQVNSGDRLTMEITGLGRLEVTVSDEGAIAYGSRIGARLAAQGSATAVG
ncbi:fumarylacetoacetate hydrolase family protein [Rhodococcus sp. NPDC056960]|uniref:fumarylacetoacetate hydrolase family protein n=1 Tax=Rhodococcus sp. NPDC056960 TaxID=3345982 RepID=UPI003635D92F